MTGAGKNLGEFGVSDDRSAAVGKRRGHLKMSGSPSRRTEALSSYRVWAQHNSCKLDYVWIKLVLVTLRWRSRKMTSSELLTHMTIAQRENQLSLPPLLCDLIASKRWQQPSDDVIFAAASLLCEPVDFLLTESQMRYESQGQCVGLANFREYRSSESEPQSLPWLDSDLALFIAVNREIGADIGIVLDYRTSSIDPRVVASDWWSCDTTCYWREVTSTFSEFVSRLRL